MRQALYAAEDSGVDVVCLMRGFGQQADDEEISAAVAQTLELNGFVRVSDGVTIALFDDGQPGLRLGRGHTPERRTLPCVCRFYGVIWALSSVDSERTTRPPGR